MKDIKVKLIKSLIKHFGKDDRRIEHSLDVTYWAARIAEFEPCDEIIVIAAALLHDTGIRDAERIEKSASGELQEKYGPPIVRTIMESIGFSENEISETCNIVGHHHTVSGIDSKNFPIIWDADMIVNMNDEYGNTDEILLNDMINKNFKTETGIKLAKKLLLSKS